VAHRVKRRERRPPFEILTTDGRRFRVNVTQEILDVGNQDDPHAELPGLMELRTDDGRAVNDHGDGTFEIVGLGIRGRRV
jgi:hypothetical protein